MDAISAEPLILDLSELEAQTQTHSGDPKSLFECLIGNNPKNLETKIQIVQFSSFKKFLFKKSDSYASSLSFEWPKTSSKNEPGHLVSCSR